MVTYTPLCCQAHRIFAADGHSVDALGTLQGGFPVFDVGMYPCTTGTCCLGQGVREKSMFYRIVKVTKLIHYSKSNIRKKTTTKLGRTNTVMDVDRRPTTYDLNGHSYGGGVQCNQGFQTCARLRGHWERQRKEQGLLHMPRFSTPYPFNRGALLAG